MSKIERLENLYLKYKNTYPEEEFVSGCGSIDSSVLLIGEAPGRDEVKLGKPFVGAAGKNLNDILGKLKISKDDIFITNTIKYRLSKLSEKTGRKINRPAAVSEIEAAINILYEEIDIIRPAFVVTLGNVPLKALTYNNFRSIGEVHGEKLFLNVLDNNYSLVPLYHPASLIYNRKLVEVYNSDIEKLKNYIKG